MNKASIQQNWDSFRQAIGITLRAVAALPEASLDSHPIPNMRTPKELVAHLFQMVGEFPQSLHEGKVEDHDETKIAAGIPTRAELLAYCHRAWEKGNTAVATLSDAQATGIVHTPWGDFPGFVMMHILDNEVVHHRGQLYCYLRALGVEPPMLYDFEHNDPAFQPKAPTSA